jgi:hypothetical protein
MVDPDIPHCRAAPPWTACGDRASPQFGCVFAHPAANGAVALSFDPAGRRHALTIFDSAALGARAAIYGRWFDVVRS